jgi:hypothetical protein
MNTYKLGRVVNHDERSKMFAFNTEGLSIVNIKHERFVPVFDQGQVGSCHDDITEVLTKDGWKLFSNTTKEDKLATVNPKTHELIYESPKRIVKLPYDGEMFNVENRSHNFSVTSDHKMLVRKWDEKERMLSLNYSFVDMKNIGWYSGLMTSVNFKGDKNSKVYKVAGIPNYKIKSQRTDLNVPMQTWLRFLGIYIAEGTMIKQTKKCPHKIQIAGFKSREKNFIRNVLSELGVHYLELKDRFTFENGRIYQEMERLGLKGIKAPFKFIPGFIFDLSSEDMTQFIMGHREGDGSYHNGTWTHHTSSKKLVEDLQRLLFLSGVKTGLSERPPRTSRMKDGRIVKGNYPEYTARSLKTDKSSIERKNDVKLKHYKGFVYCAEVPTNHTLVTRRNGYILISGNCTGNAGIGAISTTPFINQDNTTYSRDEAGAVKLYSDAETLDGDGPYPPNDHGSSGLSIAKVLQSKGLISTYQHTFSLDDALKAGSQYSFITGTNWYTGMDIPDANGRVYPTGTLRGSHEYELSEIDATNQIIWFYNSWGASWGIQGRFCMTFADYGTLLAQQGDVTILIAPTIPIPPPVSIVPSATITRSSTTGKETLGTMICTNGTNMLTLQTLELPWLNNMPNISCIPTGTYTVARTFSIRHLRWMYEILKVTQRDGIRLDVANYYYQLQGCVALGLTKSDINKDGELDVVSSMLASKALEYFFNKKPFILTIV